MKKLHFLFLGLALGILLSFTLLRTPIDRAMVAQAAELIGLEMTTPEMDTMLPGLEELRGSYASIREKEIPNDLAPSLLFNPLPNGFDVKTEQEALYFEIPKNIGLPEDFNDLAFYSVTQLASLVKSRQISSVALTEFFLQRLEKHDPTLHCVITLTKERALNKARQMDEELDKGLYRGPLHGIPFGAKDLLAAQNYKTSWGAMPYKGQVLNYDAAVVEKLEAAGAVLVAKLTLGALAWGDVWYGGKTRNPWNTEQGSSGSSAGSAAAVSAGLVPFAIGTETWGSIVSPATVCGVTGLRPTFGRVSRHGAMALSWSMDKIGPIGRTAEDCAIVFEAIRGKDKRDATTLDAAFNYNQKIDAKKLRVAYLKSDFESDYPFKKQDSMVLARLREMGVTPVAVELPEVPDIGFVLSAEAAAAFDELTRSGKDDLLVRQVRNAWPNVFRQSRFIPAVEYIQANRLRHRLIEETYRALREFDVFISPSWAGDNLLRTNLTGHPCVVLPTGFVDGLPTSITFCGQLFGEAEALKLAALYQANTNVHLQHPTAFKD